MKSLFRRWSLIAGLCWITLSGCELITNKPDTSGPPPGKDVIISEVFTLPPDRYYAYSWIELFNPTNHPIKWFDQAFPATGFVVGSSGTFIKTDNDGNPWIPEETGLTTNFNAVTFPYPDSGYAVGDGGAIVKIQRIHFPGDSVDYTFTALATPAIAANKTLRSIATVPISPSLYVVGDSGLTMRSIDRGRTWVAGTVTPPIKQTLRSIYLVDLARIYAVGDSGTIIKSTISNQWRTQLPAIGQGTTNFTSVNFVADTGWITGEGGAIASTRNGGVLWKPQTSGTTATLRAGFFPTVAAGNNLGWVVGDSGIILGTKDGGATWTRQNSGTSASLYTIEFADTSIVRGWAYGDGGTIVSTTNGGVTWTRQASGANTRLTGAFFNPLAIHLFTSYVLEMWAQRRYYFQQFPFPPNYDDIVKVDTGLVLLYPPLAQIFGETIDDIVPGGFAVIKSDSAKFANHTSLGPGNTVAVNFSLGLPLNPTDTLSQRLNFQFVLWNLLSSGEIRILKQFQRGIPTPTGDRILSASLEDVDVVRWGNFRPQSTYFFGGNTYPNNVPAGFIPEWYSLARYSNDDGEDVNIESTASSFFMSETPIPGWYSQRKKP